MPLRASILAARDARRKGSEIIGFAEAVTAALSCSLHFRDTSGTPAHALDASKMTASSFRPMKRARRLRPALGALALAATLALGGCDSFPQDQVLIVLGTPSTVATVSGEVFYYISQRAEQKLAFLPQQVTNQHLVLGG